MREHRADSQGKLSTASSSGLITQQMDSVTYLLAFTAAISGFLFGFDTSVVAASLVNIRDDLGGPLSDIQKEWIGASTSVGALIGSLVAGTILVDRYGRKVVLGFGDVFFVVGALVISTGYSVAQVILGRVILGLGVGIASSIAPMYIAEISPGWRRATLVTVQTLMITGGQVVAYALGAAFQFRGGWRALFAIGILPALIQAATIHRLPESPHFDLIRGRKQSAERTVRTIYNKGTSEEEIRSYMEEIESTVEISVEYQRRYSLAERSGLLFSTPSMRRATISAAGVMALQQLCGFNSLMYYSATIFSYAGFDNPTAVGLIVAGTNFIFTGVAMLILDRVGKRRILIFSIPGMVIGLSAAAVAFYFLTRSTGGILVEGAIYEQRWTSIMLSTMVIFISSYAIGVGNIAWNSVDFFPLEVRGMGVSVLTGTNWACNIVISSTFLTIMNRVGAAPAFAIYAGICAVGFVFVFFCYPETTGMPLADIRDLFEDGYGVEKSRVIRAELSARKFRNAYVPVALDIP